jgi:sugar O-acyltransferase (sialic acid O-acetyltransferase NeuD family)
MGLLLGGTGSFAAEIADWARAAGHHVTGLIELRDPARVGMRFHGLPAISLDQVSEGQAAAIGTGGDRRSVWADLAEAGALPCTIVHPTASRAADVELATGVTLGPLTVIGAASVVGEQTIISRGSLIGHHVTVGAFATLNPGINLGGNTQIGDGAFIGMGAVIVNGVCIGADAVIGAGAVVLRDVAAGARVQGVPARTPTPAG